MQKLIGADWLIYQNLEDLIASAADGNTEISDYECSVFNGEYVTDDVDEMYLKRLENLRSEGAKLARKRSNNAKQQDLVSDIQTEI